jgi:mannose-6-phosphate isomerase-like protein (cupin superfamily)
MEKICFILSGPGEMKVDQETREVKPGHGVWIEAGSSHALLNNGEEGCTALVVASPSWEV